MGIVAVAIGGEISARSRLAAPTPVRLGLLTADKTTRMLHGGPDAIRAEFPELAESWQATGSNSSLATPLTTAAEPFGYGRDSSLRRAYTAASCACSRISPRRR
jgi:hypothetical protein